MPTQPIHLFRPYHSEQVEATVGQVLRSGQIASGPLVAQFEEALCRLIGRPHVVSTSDLTSALVLALHLAGVGPGDEVATLAYSCLSSNSAIARVGAQAVWVDIDPETATVSLADLRRVITRRTKAVTVYHVAGYPADLRGVRALCDEHGITLVEDCNAALGASLEGVNAGSTGHFAVYSFYPNRPVHAAEGGALVCPDAETQSRAKRLRRFGIHSARFRDRNGEIDPNCDVAEIGWSASFSQLCAAIALEQLPGLAARQRRTWEVAQALDKSSEGWARARRVRPLRDARPAYWAYLVLASERDVALERLKAVQVQASRLHQRNDVYSGFGAARRFLPGTDAFMSQVLAVPCGWWLDDDQLASLTEALDLAFASAL